MQWLCDIRRWLAGEHREIVARIPLSLPGHLYISPMPAGPYDPYRQVLREYRRRRVSRVCALVTEDEISRKCKENLADMYRDAQISLEHFPLFDLQGPDTETVNAAVRSLLRHLPDACMAVHCNAGVGRTGIVVACLLRTLTGMDGDAALHELKQHMRTDITSEQQHFVRKWQPLQTHLATT